jgi:iron complex outermembrane receptor protein
MKKLLWLFIVATTINTQAQHTIKGVITDAKSNEKLAGVNILIPKINKGTVSDIDGNFTIKNIAKSEVEIRFTYVGYKDIVKIVKFNQNEKVLQIQMHENVFEMDEVIISTAFNKLQKDNVMKVSHKSVAAMERSGVQNLMDGISQVAGVSKLSTGAGISKPVIRGLTGNRVLIYNQGVRLENFQFGEAHGMGLEPSGINGVEVIKGPASLLYGSDALGGVVYLVPEKFASKNKTKADVKMQYFSNTQGAHATAGVKTSGKEWQFLSRIAYNINADYQVPDDKRVFNSRYRSTDVKLALGNKTDKRTTDLRYNYNYAQNGLPLATKNIEADYTMLDKYQDVTNHNISLKNEFKLDRSKIKTNIGFTAHKRILKWEGVDKIGMQLNTLNLDTKYYLPKRKYFESIIGVQAMWQNNNNFGKHYLLPDANVQNIGLFTTINYQKKQTVWQAGMRYDYRHISTKQVGEQGEMYFRKAVEKNLGSFTGALGMKTDINKKTHLRLNIASGFRAPNLAELTSNGAHGNRVEIGNEHLQNEQNIQFDANLEYESTHFEFFVNSFYNRINNYIYLQPQNRMLNSLPVYAYQQNNAYLYGGEAGLHLHPHPLDWLHISSSFETVTGMLQNANYLPLIPANQWKNQIRLTNRHPHKYIKKYYLNFGINHTFAADKVSSFEKQMPAYTLLNASLGANINIGKVKMTTNVSVHNALNVNYINHLSVLRDKNIADMGSNVILTLHIKF